MRFRKALPAWPTRTPSALGSSAPSSQNSTPFVAGFGRFIASRRTSVPP